MPAPPADTSPAPAAEDPLKPASYVADAPSTAFLTQSFPVELLISRAHTVEELKDKVKPQGADISGTLKNTTDQMGARLSGDGFEVHPAEVSIQALKGRTTTWHWDVTPTKSGSLTLHMDLIAEYGQDGQKERRLCDRAISVKVLSWATVVNFLQGNWQWVIAFACAPLGWFLKRKFEGGESKKSRQKHQH